MEPATKKVRMEGSQETKAQLKPSEVTKSSNIFGPSVDSEDSQAGSDEEIDSEEQDDEFDIDDDDDEEEEEEGEDDEQDEEEEEEEYTRDSKNRKKSNPQDFSTAMQKILGSSLTTSNRRNPILARSIERQRLDQQASEAKISAKIRMQESLQHRALLERGHLPASALLSSTHQHGDEEQEGDEKRFVERIEAERGMKKIAQRGVVRLFNAIRAAQLSSPASPGASNDHHQLALASSSGRSQDGGKGGIRVKPGAGVKKRIEQAQEVSKQSFLELIKAGGRPGRS